MQKSIFVLTCLLALALALAAPAQAQTGFGIKGGMTIAKLTGDNTDALKSRTGFMVGGYAAIPIGEGTAIQPELNYAQKGAKFETENGDVNEKFDYIEIPVLFKYTVAGEGARPYFLVGPYLGFNTSAKIESGGQSVDVGDEIKSTDFGLVFGIGVELQKFLIEARYGLGLTDIYQEPEGVEDLGSLKTSTIAFQIGYAFPTP